MIGFFLVDGLFLLYFRQVVFFWKGLKKIWVSSFDIWFKGSFFKEMLGFLELGFRVQGLFNLVWLVAYGGVSCKQVVLFLVLFSFSKECQRCYKEQ